jgi:predicted O-methyltransferase YrrM
MRKPTKQELLPRIDPVLTNYVGRFYSQLADKNWAPYIAIPSGPINYLEIGCADGGNAVIVAKSYAHHPESKLYCVDPWADYDQYGEYKGQQEAGWETFNRNIQKCSNPAKFVINRGLSEDVVPTFPDQFFDLVFVDGNHETEYVYRDGLMSLEKVKIGGYIVFDDYINSWPSVVAGVKKFVETAGSRIRVVADLYSTLSHLRCHIGQLIVQRTA